jgi:hypothetical protein
MTADLDTLLTALYVELTDRIIPFREPGRRGPGRPPDVTDAELACLAVAQVLLRCDGERHWLRAAPRLVGHLFPRLLAQSQYNTRLRQIAPLMEAALRWLADATPATAELLRLMDATPVPCGTSAVTAKTPRPVRARRPRVLPEPFALVLGRQAADHLHLRRDRHRVQPRDPKLHGEWDQARQTLERQPANRPAPGTAVVTDKGLSGQGTEEFFVGDSLGLTLLRPARKDEKQPRPFPNCLRQRVEAVIWTLKNQLGLERHGGHHPCPAAAPASGPSGARSRR